MVKRDTTPHHHQKCQHDANEKRITTTTTTTTRNDHEDEDHDDLLTFSRSRSSSPCCSVVDCVLSALDVPRRRKKSVMSEKSCARIRVFVRTENVGMARQRAIAIHYLFSRTFGRTQRRNRWKTRFATGIYMPMIYFVLEVHFKLTSLPKVVNAIQCACIHVEHIG